MPCGILPRLAFSTIVAVAVTLPNWGCQSHPPLGPGNVVMAPADGGAVSFPLGAVLQIDLPSNPTTGYRWQVDSLPPGLVIQGEAIRVRNPDGGVAGGGGIEQWRFTAGRNIAGEVLRMSYRRPWEPDEVPARTYEVTVTAGRG